MFDKRKFCRNKRLLEIIIRNKRLLEYFNKIVLAITILSSNRTENRLFFSHKKISQLYI